MGGSVLVATPDSVHGTYIELRLRLWLGWGVAGSILVLWLRLRLRLGGAVVGPDQF